MKIERLGRGTILVSLRKEDMYRYALSGDMQDVETGLRSLLSRVGEVCGLDHRGKSYLVEALPAREGCLLVISVHRRRRRVYRVKRSSAREACVFFDADAMLDYLRIPKRSVGSFYLYEGQYVFLPSLSSSRAMIAQLSEYGALYPLSPAMQARIGESGVLLRQEDIHRRHISADAVAVRDAAFRDADGGADDLGQVGSAG